MIRRRAVCAFAMTLPATTYDLVLMLDPQVEEPVRAKIVTDVSEAIEAKGQLERHDEWGERALAYPIDHKATAEYHLLQFHVVHWRADRGAEPNAPYHRRGDPLSHKQAKARDTRRARHASRRHTHP